MSFFGGFTDELLKLSMKSETPTTKKLGDLVKTPTPKPKTKPVTDVDILQDKIK